MAECAESEKVIGKWNFLDKIQLLTSVASTLLGSLPADLKTHPLVC